MSAPDTGTPAVEALASDLGSLPFRMTIDEFDQAAATLRALAAERDEALKDAEFWRECSDAHESDWQEAKAERDAAVEQADLTWFWAIVDRDGLTGVISDERAALSHLVAASAERDTLKVAVAVARTQRDAARAEVAALREALALAETVCGKNNCNCPGAPAVRVVIRAALDATP